MRAGAFDRLDPDRARLLANVPQAMEAAEQKAREQAAGQGGLFDDAFFGGSDEAPAREWLPAERWDDRQRLLEEKGALGYFLTGHLFDACRDEVRRFELSRELWIEREDFAENPPKGFFRMTPGQMVRLRHGFVVRCTGVDRDANGEILALDPQLAAQLEAAHAPFGVMRMAGRRCGCRSSPARRAGSGTRPAWKPPRPLRPPRGC